MRSLTTVHLAQVRDLGERSGVTERDVADAVVREGGERVDDSRFLSSSRPGGGHEHPSILPVISTSAPLTARGVPERLYGVLRTCWIG
jgi:hypothetical protein